MRDFIDLKLNKKNIDNFQIRQSILKSLTANLSLFNGNLLDVGCGKMPYKNYILKNSKVSNYVGLDIESAIEYDTNIKPDFTWDAKTMPFENESFDTAFATEVLEHCFEPEVLLSEVYRVLKPGGTLFFTVPFLWNLHETPHDAYRYTPFSLERHLKNSGFKNMELTATGGWHASMAQMLGLWIGRSSMSSVKRKVLASLGIPIIKMLLKKSQSENKSFSEGQMITGIYGIVKKDNN